MKVYISGPISGLAIAEVIATFRTAEAMLRRRGMTPVSSLDNGLPFEAEWADQMGRDVAMLLRCEAILLLPGWERSEGAVLEELIARRRGMRLLFWETLSRETP